MSDTLQELVIQFVRTFGLHQPDRTPCGQPLSVSEAHALSELRKAPGLSQNELAAKLQLEKSTVSRLAASLAKRGWLTRRKDETDSRVWRLYLTEQGEKTATRIEESRKEKFRAVASALTDERMEIVEEGLRELIGALKREGESDHGKK
ncbi:MarR family winged helix-turn-helix transcriptional regulator [Paenibacillus alkalitolerans]|uniref:MarR family winged helix-turn-helix transcriptional regulator n=1 Tax=Paenibacillus alkalitolerans TaxID=2799335 RepID=UPI0018F68BF4|nr:MarR family transcriptional regulator [Paenibacillus alkalitolerans]